MTMGGGMKWIGRVNADEMEVIGCSVGEPVKEAIFDARKNEKRRQCEVMQWSL